MSEHQKPTHPGTDENSNAISGSLAGNQDFWAFWAELEGYLLSLCKKWMNGSVVEPEEALSGAMLRAWEGFTRTDAKISNVRAWLTRVTHNYCMDIHRREKRRAGGASADDFIRREREPDGMRSESPEETLLRREAFSGMKVAINRLPERLRNPMILRCVEGLPYREIAQKLNISNENVRKRVQQAREILNEYGDKFPHLAEIKKHDPVSSLRADEPVGAELPGHFEFLLPVRFQDDLGKWREVRLFLEEKPSRIEQKTVTLEKYIKKFPGGWKKRWELGQLLMLTGQFQEAKSQLEWIFERQPWFFPAIIQLGKLSGMLGNAHESAMYFRDAAAKVRREDTVRHLRALAAESDGDPDQGILGMTRAFEASGHPAHLWELARMETARGNYPRVHAILTRIFNISGPSTVLFSQLVEVCKSLGLLEEAARWVKLLEKESPDFVTATTQITEQQLETGHAMGQSIRDFRNAVRKATQENTFELRLQIRRAVLTGHPRRGLELLRRLCRNAHITQEERLIAIEGYFQLGAEGQSHALLCDLLKDFPGDSAVLLRCFRVLAQSLQPRKPEIPLPALIRKYSGHWEVLSWGGLAWAKVGGNIETALMYVQQAVYLQPEMAVSWINLGTTHLVAGNRPEAIRAFRKALRCKQIHQTPLAFATAAMTLLYAGETGHRPEAEKAIAKLMETLPLAGEFFQLHLLYKNHPSPKSARKFRNLCQKGLAHPFNIFPPGNYPFLTSLQPS